MSLVRSTMVVLVATCAVATMGCVFGFGSTYVGQWTAHREVDHTICIEDATRSCASVTDVIHDAPARSFSGVDVLIPAVGIAQAREEGRGGYVAARLEPGLEYLRGHGPWALGVRGSTVFEFDSRGSRLLVPITFMGHLNVAERLTLHGGLGYAPFARVTRGGSSADNASTARGLVGIDVLLSRSGEVYFTSRTELDTLLQLSALGSYRSTGLTTSIALNF